MSLGSLMVIEVCICKFLTFIEAPQPKMEKDATAINSQYSVALVRTRLLLRIF